MITERDDRQQNDRAALAWSLLVSALLNLLVWMLAVGHWGMLLRSVTRPPKPQEFLISSTAVTIRHKIVPAPQHVRSLARPPTQPRPQREPVQPRRAAVPRPEARPTELAHLVPNASPQPRSAPRRERPASLAQQLAAQEKTFAREAQRLSASNAPISVATPSHFTPSTYQRTYMDLNGKDPRESVTALLMPLPGRHWIANGMSCYYVHYSAEFSGGGSEEGNIPWPVCYPENHDAMLPLDHPHPLPVPAPPVGYVLPPNATIGPLLREIYAGKIHN